MTAHHPDGCTQAMEDAAVGNYEPSEHAEKLARDVIETRALGEILMMTEGFVEWLMEQESADLAKMFSYAVNPDAQDFKIHRGKMEQKYYEYRLRIAEQTEEWYNEIRRAEA